MVQEVYGDRSRKGEIEEIASSASLLLNYLPEE